MSSVAIIDYGSGNLRSAAKAFERAAREVSADADIVVTSDPEVVRAADRIVLPGVGAFADCRAGLDAVAGMVDVLEERVIRQGTPFFGVCVGMQLMATEGREKTVTQGLGWIDGAVIRIEPKGGLKVPHMGWNTLTLTSSECPLFAGLPPNPSVYFVHGYYPVPTDDAIVAATTDYPTPFASVIWRDNVFATQFHPEKSQAIGLRMLANFAAI